MRYLALATDYDGTLATHGQVSEEILASLKRLRESGRKLILVTGRELDELRKVFPELDWFDCVVAENGALIYDPIGREEQSIGNPPPEAFVEKLKSQNVEPLSVGRVIVATWEPNETIVLETIRDLGLELQVIFNKGAVMVLPSGINKAAGLQAALDKMRLSPHNVVGVGDAENDHAFLDLCELSVAVANALPMVKERVDWVTQNSRGEGVAELIEGLLESDLAEWGSQSDRHQITLGTQEDGIPLGISPYGTSILLAGTSGGGKSTLATGILERLAEQGYQFCIIDPEGDYESFEGAVVLGSSDQAPNDEEVLDLLRQPNQNVVVNLLAVKLENRPAFFMKLLPLLLEMRSSLGRPHWLVIDEAHHLLPTSWEPSAMTLPQSLDGMMLITVHPEHVALPALSLVDTMLVIGKQPRQTLESFCQAVGYCPPETTLPETLEQGQALFWSRKTEASPLSFEIQPPRVERRRHRRKYAKGELGDDKCFFFRGAQSKLNLRAQNLIIFSQLAEGVDEETWLYHLQQQDYSRWFREAIKDEALAEEAAQIETNSNLSAGESRDRIKELIEERYTLPA
jgi:hypothetical protein